MIRFELPFAIETLNPLMRRKNRRSHRSRDQLAWHVLHALGRQRPPAPLGRCHMRVERYSVGDPDPDNLITKNLLDILQPMSKRHPAGLGVISGDSKEWITREIIAVRVRRRAEQKTIVTIEEISG